MVTILLTLLKILGIILASVLGILLIVLLLVLFAPIVYRADGSVELPEISVRARARWLFGLLRVSFSYPEDQTLFVKLLWITLYDSSRRKRETSAKKRRSKENPPRDSKKDVKADENDEALSSTEGCGENATSVTAEEYTASTAGTDTSSADSASDASEDSADASNHKSKKQAKHDIHDKVSQIRAFPQRIKFTFQKFYDKIKHIREEWDFYKRLLEDEATKDLIAHAKKRLSRILHSIRPRRIEADLIVGTGAPDTTGYLYGVYGMLSPKLPKVFLTPDFEEAILQGRFRIGGHITVGKLLFHAGCLLTDKKLKLLKHRIDRHRSQQKKQQAQTQNASIE